MRYKYTLLWNTLYHWHDSLNVGLIYQHKQKQIILKYVFISLLQVSRWVWKKKRFLKRLIIKKKQVRKKIFHHRIQPFKCVSTDSKVLLVIRVSYNWSQILTTYLDFRLFHFIGIFCGKIWHDAPRQGVCVGCRRALHATGGCLGVLPQEIILQI